MTHLKPDMSNKQRAKAVEAHLKRSKYSYPSGNMGRRHEGLSLPSYLRKAKAAA